MGYDERFIAMLAIGIATVATAIAVGPWNQPYRLRSIAAISQRYGKPVARAIWVLVALIMFATSWAIVRGVRPTFAVPSQDVSVKD